MTTRAEYITQGLTIPSDVEIIESFAGNCDLLKLVKNNPVECYDVNSTPVIKRDSLLNPPYLARNKSPDKTIFDIYGVNDLYKCFIKSIIEDSQLEE